MFEKPCEKSGSYHVVQSGCARGARAPGPLRRRPFGRRVPVDENVGKPGPGRPVHEGTAPLTRELRIGMSGNSTLRGDELEFIWRRPAPWHWQAVGNESVGDALAVPGPVRYLRWFCFEKCGSIVECFLS